MAAVAAGKSVMRLLRIVVGAACFAAASMSIAYAQNNDPVERVTNYVSDITVEANGTLAVRETITINAQGFQFDHGIFRDFPTVYGDGRHVSFDVSRVTRDGHDEPYEIDGLGIGKRVKIGSADVDLSNGLHVYTIDYTTDRQIGFSPKFDELYWNVNGNGWRFQIDQVTATVHLPPTARILQSSYYTGRLGEKLQDATAERVSGNVIRFTTTQPLGHKAGLTIAVGFAKGAVSPPSQDDLHRYLLRDHLPIAAALFGLAIMTLYYFVAWVLVGRDPSGGTVIPLFEAPDGLSPAAVRYLRQFYRDDKMFAATLVSLAVKGVLKISQDDDKTYTLTRAGDGSGLTDDEQATANGSCSRSAKPSSSHKAMRSA